jgi:hypothetical protein
MRVYAPCGRARAQLSAFLGTAMYASCLCPASLHACTPSRCALHAACKRTAFTTDTVCRQKHDDRHAVLRPLHVPLTPTCPLDASRLSPPALTMSHTTHTCIHFRQRGKTCSLPRLSCWLVTNTIHQVSLGPRILETLLPSQIMSAIVTLPEPQTRPSLHPISGPPC